MKIRVTGPESSGKSTLARALAWSLDGLFVAEAARAYLHARGGSYRRPDLLSIWQQQMEREDRATAAAASYVICDTGPEVVQIWSEVKFEWVDPAVRNAVDERRYDLTLLCAPDLPWVSDPLREYPEDEARWRHFERYRSALPAAFVIRGADRVGQALRLLRGAAGGV